MQNLTPLMTQYQEIKRAYTDAVLLFQMGDFFECFGDDAIKVSQILGLVLTSREKRSDAPPMAGFPIKALDEYLPKLVQHGEKVAVARQMELPSAAKGIVRRAVTEVITQGTITTQESLLSGDKNYLVAITTNKNVFGIAVADISTGELKVFQSHGGHQKLSYILEKLGPKEIIKSSEDEFIIPETLHTVIQPVPKSEFSKEKTNKTLLQHFSIKNLDAIGLTEYEEASKASGAIIAYIIDTKKTDPKHINKIELWNPDNALVIDPTTQRNLEIFYNLRTHLREGSLMEILDTTKSAMGHRLLYEWASFPLTNEHDITQRLDVVSWFCSHQTIAKESGAMLQNIPDLERLASMVGLGRIHPKQILAIKKGMEASLQVLQVMEKQNDLPKQLQDLAKTIDRKQVAELVELISVSINDYIEMENSGIFKKGFSPELDELLTLAHQGNKLIKDIFLREKEKTGISNLKLGFNRVFGYYFETSHGNAKFIPNHFIKKQTLVNNDRYITEEVKELESKVLSAQENLSRMEENLFQEFVAKLQPFIHVIQQSSRLIAHIDVLLSFADTAIRSHFVRPEFVSDKDEIVLTDSIHPVVREHVDEFVPNSITISPEQNFLIITGPNMGGKSTFVRQIALIHIMAQIGSFVSASTAKLRIIDKLFARIGASDDISTGRSTFMVELSEVANIVKNATKKSLIILDEVGRGTSTYEGIALAWGISEYIAKRIGCTTIFTTHFREITELENTSNIFINYKVNILEENKNVYFLHTITKGISDKSYGIHVAKLVDLPEEIITRSTEILDHFENTKAYKALRKTRVAPEAQLSLIDANTDTKVVPSENEQYINEVKNIDINATSPLEALKLLADLQKKLRNT